MYGDMQPTRQPTCRHAFLCVITLTVILKKKALTVNGKEDILNHVYSVYFYICRMHIFNELAVLTIFYEINVIEYTLSFRINSLINPEFC